METVSADYSGLFGDCLMWRFATRQVSLSFSGLHRRRTKDFEGLGKTTRKSWSETTQVVLDDNAQSYKETEGVR